MRAHFPDEGLDEVLYVEAALLDLVVDLLLEFFPGVDGGSTSILWDALGGGAWDLPEAGGGGTTGGARGC